LEEILHPKAIKEKHSDIFSAIRKMSIGSFIPLSKTTSTPIVWKRDIGIEDYRKKSCIPARMVNGEV
jgi:hypothetical protein